MGQIKEIIKILSNRAREKRANLFKGLFALNENTRILDLGSETGSNINAVLTGSPVKPENVYIADIDKVLIDKGRDAFGYVPVLIGESGRLPYPDGYFDILYCSSVIEHVTVKKEQVWSIYCGSSFKSKSLVRQKDFLEEIQRLGKQYFVQTPNKHFPIESHSWLPFLAWLPRRLLIPVLKFTNRFWVKKTNPDWHLLNIKEMTELFYGAKIVNENFFGLTKSIMTVKHNIGP